MEMSVSSIVSKRWTLDASGGRSGKLRLAVWVERMMLPFGSLTLMGAMSACMLWILAEETWAKWLLAPVSAILGGPF